jgi:hypothetical protein
VELERTKLERNKLQKEMGALKMLKVREGGRREAIRGAKGQEKEGSTPEGGNSLTYPLPFQ